MTAGDSLIRMAEIEVDPNQVEAYRGLLAAAMQLAVRREPGVLMLHAMSPADRPHVFRVFEMYRSRADYEAHLTTEHFLAYKTGTAGMVRSLILQDAGWASLCGKAHDGTQDELG